MHCTVKSLLYIDSKWLVCLMLCTVKSLLYIDSKWLVCLMHDCRPVYVC